MVRADRRKGWATATILALLSSSLARKLRPRVTIKPRQTSKSSLSSLQLRRWKVPGKGLLELTWRALPG